MRRKNTLYPKDNIGCGEQDTWFVTFTFPIAIGEQKAEERVKEWLRRLRQTLALREDEVFVSYLLARQLRGVWHAHMEVKVQGLSKLDHKKWESKWSDITGRKVTNEITIHKTRRIPGIKRRRNGEEQVVSSIIKSEKKVVGEESHYVGGGTCMIMQVGQKYLSSRRKQEYVCTISGIRNYLACRHSSEMKADDLNRDSHTFLGIS
jgi:hypothetical protein